MLLNTSGKASEYLWILLNTSDRILSAVRHTFLGQFSEKLQNFNFVAAMTNARSLLLLTHSVSLHGNELWPLNGQLRHNFRQELNVKIQLGFQIFSLN